MLLAKLAAAYGGRVDLLPTLSVERVGSVPQLVSAARTAGERCPEALMDPALAQPIPKVRCVGPPRCSNGHSLTTGMAMRSGLPAAVQHPSAQLAALADIERRMVGWSKAMPCLSLHHEACLSARSSQAHHMHLGALHHGAELLKGLMHRPLVIGYMLHLHRSRATMLQWTMSASLSGTWSPLLSCPAWTGSSTSGSQRWGCLIDDDHNRAAC